jgi:hypothetical protein
MKGVDYKTLYWHADGDRVVCDLCPHGCRLKDGQSGICRSRVNVGGELVATAYGRLCSIANDPIEKKPLQRFSSWNKMPLGCIYRLQSSMLELSELGDFTDAS